jgi:hypothetical protein
MWHPARPRGVGQISHGFLLVGVGVGGGVVVAVLGGVQDGLDGVEGGFGDLGVDGGLAAGFVPQDGEVEDLEQLRFEVRWEAGQDVPGDGELVEEFGVGGVGGGGGEGLELGFEEFAFVVQFGEPGADPGAVGLVGGVTGFCGDVFQFDDLGVLRGFDPGDPGVEGFFLGVPVGGCGCGGGGELGGEQGGAVGAEDPVSEELAHGAVQEEFGDLDGAGVVGVVGGVLGVGPVVGAPVVGDLGGDVVGVPGHPALAVPAADP